MTADVALEATDDTLRPFRVANLRAYLAVLAAWVAVSAAVAWIANATTTGQPSFLGYLIVSLVAVMGGVAIMFRPSLLNLRKLRPSFERLARGEQDPKIPPVWCPVLTSATQAARRLANEVATKRERKE